MELKTTSRSNNYVIDCYLNLFHTLSDRINDNRIVKCINKYFDSNKKLKDGFMIGLIFWGVIFLLIWYLTGTYL